jgi:hypothetical protein
MAEKTIRSSKYLPGMFWHFPVTWAKPARWFWPGMEIRDAKRIQAAPVGDLLSAGAGVFVGLIRPIAGDT